MELFCLGPCSWWDIVGKSPQNLSQREDVHTGLDFILNQQEFLKWDINIKNDPGKESTGVSGKSKTTQKEIP